LEAHGEVVRLASQNAIVQGRLEGTETGKLVAIGQGVWRVYGP
jgi:acyl-coenzyme A thioesterase PaaI-like protein